MRVKSTVLEMCYELNDKHHQLVLKYQYTFLLICLKIHSSISEAGTLRHVF